MNQDSVTTSRIEWLRVFPILHLWKAVRMGFRVRVLLPCLFVPTWFFVDAQWSPTLWRFLYNESRSLNPSTPGIPAPLSTIVHAAGQLHLGTYESFIGSCSTLILAMLFTTLVGIAVARATATEFCQQTRTGMIASLIFATQHCVKGLVSLGLTIGISAVPWLAFVGICKLPGLFAMNGWVTNLCFPFMALMGVFSVVTSVVCVFGWRLSLAAIGTDRCHAGDALSRGINYVLSHKLYTAAIVGSTCLVSYVAARIVHAGILLSLEMLRPEFNSILKASSVAPPVEIWDVWLKGLQILPNAVQLGVFLAGMTIGYALLRQAEDAVHLREMDGGKPLKASGTATA